MSIEMKGKIRSAVLIYGLIVIFLLPSSVFGQPIRIPVSVIEVIDGETITVIFEGVEESVKLIGIDTPEERYSGKAFRDAKRMGRDLPSYFSLGRDASKFARSLFGRGDIVHLEFDAQQRDEDGRLLAYVWLSDGRMLNEIIVAEGYGNVYTSPPNVKYEERLINARRQAIESKKGLWGQ